MRFCVKMNFSQLFFYKFFQALRCHSESENYFNLMNHLNCKEEKEERKREKRRKKFSKAHKYHLVRQIASIFAIYSVYTCIRLMECNCHFHSMEWEGKIEKSAEIFLHRRKKNTFILQSAVFIINQSIIKCCNVACQMRDGKMVILIEKKFLSWTHAVDYSLYHNFILFFTLFFFYVLIAFIYVRKKF